MVSNSLIYSLLLLVFLLADAALALRVCKGYQVDQIDIIRDYTLFWFPFLLSVTTLLLFQQVDCILPLPRLELRQLNGEQRYVS